jgi:hypothetical protein
MILDLETLKCPFGMRVKLQDTPKKSVFVYWFTQRVSFHYYLHWCFQWRCKCSEWQQVRYKVLELCCNSHNCSKRDHNFLTSGYSVMECNQNFNITQKGKKKT